MWPTMMVSLRAPSYGNFPRKMSGNYYLSRNLLKEFLFHFTRLNYNLIKIDNKHVFDKQLAKSLCFNFMHYAQKKNNFFSMVPNNISEF